MLNLNNFGNTYYIWWKNIDKIILFLILLLFFLGLFFSLVSTSLIASDKLDTNSYFFFFKHLVFVFIGFLILICFSAMDINKTFNIYNILFLISFLTLLMVPLIGIEVKGSKRWLEISFLPRFQPIEILKPFFIVLLATILTSSKNKNLHFKYLLTTIVTIPTILLLVSQPDIGQSILIILIWLSLIFISGLNLLIFFSFVVFFILLISYLVFFVPKFLYIKNRLLSFLDPSAGNSSQSEKASEAIINGGFFGKGLGEGTLNSKIPEAHTDYLVSVISEEFGVIIVILIMLIYLFLAYKVIKKIGDEKIDKIKLILLGAITLILLQTFIHIGVNIRILPTTGMTLPFLSYGGSSIIGNAFLSGIILNLTKRRIH